MTSPYALFSTDTALEQDGILLDYGSFRLRIARAGGTNRKFQQVLEAKLKPHRRQIQTETLADDVAHRLIVEAYADAVLLGWGRRLLRWRRCVGWSSPGSPSGRGSRPIAAHGASPVSATRRAGRLCLLTVFLSGCATAGSDPGDLCPPWPGAGPAVAEELARICLPEERCPALWDWVRRLDRLRRQLDACRG